MKTEESDKFLPDVEKVQRRDNEHSFEDAFELTGKK